MTIRSTWSLALVGAVGASLITGCTTASEPRVEAIPSVGAVGAASPTETPTAPATSMPSPTEPTEALKVEPLADLGRGLFFVDVRSGAASRLPKSITSVRGAGNYDVSPDGSMILFDNSGLAAPSDEAVERGLHQLYVANIDGSHVRQLTDDPVGATEGSWSPDGTKVVYLGGWARLCCYRSPADLTVLDLETGTTTVLAHGPASRFSEPFFSADGNSILFADWKDAWRADLWTIRASGGRPEPLLVEGQGSAVSSPDGASFVYELTETWYNGRCGSSYRVLWISDADGRRPRMVVPQSANEPRAAGDAAWSPDGTRIAYSASIRPPEGCGFGEHGVYVMDVATRDRTLIALGTSIDWLDDRTLLIRSWGRR